MLDDSKYDTIRSLFDIITFKLVKQNCGIWWCYDFFRGLVPLKTQVRLLISTVFPFLFTMLCCICPLVSISESILQAFKWVSSSAIA